MKNMLKSIDTLFLSHFSKRMKLTKDHDSPAYVNNYSCLNHETTSKIVRTEGTVGREQVNHSINSQTYFFSKLHKDPFKTIIRH